MCESVCVSVSVCMCACVCVCGGGGVVTIDFMKNSNGFVSCQVEWHDFLLAYL